MHFLRALIQDHRSFALLLIFCALFVKALIPAGYMIGPSTKILTVTICTDVTGEMVSKQIEIPMESGSHDPSSGHGKADGSCSFTSLAMAGLTGADAQLLAVALAFILLLGFAPTALALTSNNHHLRPPLRGPPAAV